MPETASFAEANSKLPYLRVVLAHVDEDASAVRASLYAPLLLDSTNFDVWFGEERILPGQDKRELLRQAIAHADVLLLCLSSHSVTSPPRARLKSEIMFALEEANRRSAGTILLIPSRLDTVSVPSRLRHLASVDAFSEVGYKRLVGTLYSRANSLGKDSPAVQTVTKGREAGSHNTNTVSGWNRKFLGFMKSVPNTLYFLISLLAGVTATLGFLGMPTYNELLDRIDTGSIFGPSDGDTRLNGSVSTPSRISSLTLSSSRDPVGQTWTAAGTGFEPGELVRIFWDTTGTPISIATATDAGSISIEGTTPMTTNGIHTVNAVGESSAREAEAPFHVIVNLTKTPLFGSPGTDVTVSLTGFGGEETIDLYWPNDSGMRFGTAKTSKDGSGIIVFSIPMVPSGRHDFLVTGLNSGREAWGSVLVRESESTPMSSSSPSATPIPG